jgi:transposase
MATTSFKFSEYPGNTRFYCGLDVHKHQLAVSIYGKDDSGHELVKCETFGTDPKSLESFFAFTARFRPVCYGMEATNVYHHVIYTLLEKKSLIVDWTYDIIVFNPSDMTGIPGHHKHDRHDATQIARYLAAGLLKPSKGINVVLEDMRAVFRMAARLERDRTALKNRVKKTLDRAGIRPDKMNLNVQWVGELLYTLIKHDGTLGEAIEWIKKDPGTDKRQLNSLIRNMKKFEPYLDISLTPGQRALINQDLVELDFKTSRVALLAVEIDRIIAIRPGLRQSIMNIASIPGLTPFSAAWLLSEVGPITRYPSHRKFTAYCGCCERVVRSADTTYSAHTLRRANKHARTILYNTARVLCHVVKKDSALKRYCTRVYAKKHGKHPALAYCTIATKLSRIVYAMLKNGTGFDPALAANKRGPARVDKGLLTITDRKKLRHAQKALKRVIALKEQGVLSPRVAYFARALEDALKEN